MQKYTKLNSNEFHSRRVHQKTVCIDHFRSVNQKSKRRSLDGDAGILPGFDRRRPLPAGGHRRAGAGGRASVGAAESGESSTGGDGPRTFFFCRRRRLLSPATSRHTQRTHTRFIIYWPFTSLFIAHLPTFEWIKFSIAARHHQ